MADLLPINERRLGEWLKTADEWRLLINAAFDSGFYTPVSSNETNINSITPTEAQWMRVKDVVTVSGRFEIDISTESTETLFELDLPIASAISQEYYVAGVTYDAGLITSGGEVYGNTVNNTAQFRIAVLNGGVLFAPYSYTYTYRIAT